MSDKVAVNEDVDDLIEEAYYAMTGLLTASDYLAGKGYDKELDRLERSCEQLRRWLFTPNEQRTGHGWDGHEICDAPSSCAHAQWAMG